METLRLAAICFFADLPEDELAAVASIASEVEIPPGQLLAEEGRVGYSLQAIESGTADVVINGETVGTSGLVMLQAKWPCLFLRLTGPRRRKWR